MNNPTSFTAHIRTSRRRRLAAGVLIAVTPLATLACGNDGATATDAAESSSQQATRNDGGSESADEFQQCLAENGIELGTPETDGNSSDTPAVDDEAFQRAQEECGDLMQRGGGGGGFPGGGMDSEALQEWTACLSENGVELEIPSGGANGPGGGPREMPEDGQRPEQPSDGERPSGGAPFGLDTSDPEVAAATAACESLQPQMGARPEAGGSAPEAPAES